MGERLAAEVQRGPVAGGVAGGHALAQEAVVALAPGRFAVVVHAVRVWQQAQPGDPLRRAVEGRHRLAEPAQRSRAQAAQHDAAPPALAQHLVEPVRAPDAHQRHDAAAADVDEVLVEQVLGEVAAQPGALVAAKQRDVRRLAAAGREGAVEAHDVVVGVARRRRQEADLRMLDAGARQHVLVEQAVARLHRESASPERDDLGWKAIHRPSI